MTISFLDSLDKYMPIYYHFLDGYINKNVGFNIDKIYDLILGNNILHKPNGITLLKYTINNNIINLNFSSSKTNIQTLKFNLKNIRANDEILKMFHYCICQIINDNHITSLLFFIKDNNLYVSSLII
jgi:hypothetical protein